MIFIFLNGHTEQFSDRMALKPKMDTVCTLLDFVGIGVFRFSWCLPDAFRYLPDAFPMLSDIFPIAFQCLPMPVSSAFPIPSRCLANPFPILYLSNPFLTPLHESLPNYFFFPTPSCLKIRHRKDIGKASGSIPSEPIGTSKLQLLRVPHRPNIGKASERRRKEWV